VGESVSVLFAPGSAADLLSLASSYRSGKAAVHAWFGVAMQGMRADGATFPAEVSLRPVERGRSKVLFATVVDVSYRAVLREWVARSELAPSMS
jgi:PAS domain S-box-containing protein